MSRSYRGQPSNTIKSNKCQGHKEAYTIKSNKCQGHIEVIHNQKSQMSRSHRGHKVRNYTLHKKQPNDCTSVMLFV